MDTALCGISAGPAAPDARERGVRPATGRSSGRWLRRACDCAARLAGVAAGLCPALSSIGGALVGALITAVVAVALVEPTGWRRAA